MIIKKGQHWTFLKDFNNYQIVCNICSKNLNFFVGASRILFRLASEVDPRNENKI